MQLLLQRAVVESLTCFSSKDTQSSSGLCSVGLRPSLVPSCIPALGKRMGRGNIAQLAKEKFSSSQGWSMSSFLKTICMCSLRNMCSVWSASLDGCKFIFILYFLCLQVSQCGSNATKDEAKQQFAYNHHPTCKHCTHGAFGKKEKHKI